MTLTGAWVVSLTPSDRSGDASEEVRTEAMIKGVYL